MEQEELVAVATPELATSQEPIQNIAENVQSPDTSDAPEGAHISEQAATSEEPSHGVSLLSGVTQKEKEDPSKKEEKPPEEVAKVEDAKPAETTSYEQFTMPEGVNMPKEYFDKFTDVVGKFGVSQEAAQQLIDMHIDAVKGLSQKTLSDQWEVFHNQQKEWVNDVMADPILGGSGHQTAMSLAAKGIENLVPPHEREAFNHVLSVTGAGNHKSIIMAFHRAGQLLGESSRVVSEGIKPPPDRGSKPTGKLSNIYNHPTSQNK